MAGPEDIARLHDLSTPMPNMLKSMGETSRALAHGSGAMRTSMKPPAKPSETTPCTTCSGEDEKKKKKAPPAKGPTSMEQAQALTTMMTPILHGMDETSSSIIGNLR